MLNGSNFRFMSIINQYNKNDINLKVLKCIMQISKQLYTQNTRFIHKHAKLM